MGESVPKFNPARRNARVGPLKLPKEGRQGPPPKWPLSVPMTEYEQQAWRDLWKKPQAVAWEQTNVVRAVARYCRIMVAAELPGAKVTLMAEARQLEDKLGLTPKSMRLLLWEIVDDEVAQARQNSDVDNARNRIRAVG